jgi:5-methylcytosine-specific restriction endonuclease McrA
MTKPKRSAILAKSNGHCAYCGIKLTGKWQIDHMHPIIRIPVRRSIGTEALSGVHAWITTGKYGMF